MTKVTATAPKNPLSQSSSRRLTIALYTTAVFFYWVGLYLYVPTLPVYIQSKVESLSSVGLVLSMYGLWMAIIRLPLGIAADWTGWRKPFILAGLALTALGAWLLSSAEDSTGLLAGRAITGLAAGTWVPLIVSYTSLFPREETIRATALLAMIGSIGRMMATSATGFLNEVGGYPLAFSLATVASGLAILIMLFADEKRAAPKRPSPDGLFTLSTRRDVLIPSLLSAAGQYINWTVTFGFLPILAADLGANDVTQSMLMSLSVAMFVAGNYLTAIITNRVDGRRLILVYFVLLSLSTGAAALATQLWTLFASQMVLGLAHGIGNPLLMGLSIRYVDNAERSTAMGLHQSVYGIGMFVGPGLSGLLADGIGVQPMFGVTAVTGLGLGLVGVRMMTGQRNVHDRA